MGYGPEAPVAIFQHESEFVELLGIYRERAPRKLLEIGSYHGGTLYHWLQNATPPMGIVSVDTYTAADNRSLYSEWTPEGVELEVVEGDSHDPDVIERVRQLGPFDWIFIDADHYYEPVKADWENYSAMATPGAVIVFHDIITSDLHPEIEVERLWREIAKKHWTREIVESWGNAWGGLGVVFMP